MLVPPDAEAQAKLAFAREQRKKDLEDRIARWKAIAETGSIENWIEAQIKAKGLAQSAEYASLKTDAERAAWKDKKKAESEERKQLAKLGWKAYHATHVVHLGAGVHWDDNPDPDRFDPPDRDQRLQSNGLPDFKTAQELADALGMTVSKLRWLTYRRDVDSGSHYRRWSIPKRNGKRRTITAPKSDLKRAQRWALRNVFEKLPVHGAAHGFLPARSIVSNAKPHAGADVIVKVDVKDFFPTITWRRVKGLLRARGLREGAATLLSLLASESPRDLVQFRGRNWWVASGPAALPQGAPTSPAISNAVCLHLDRRMSGLARKLGFRYTRYADDLVFSWFAAGAAKKTAPVGTLLHGVRLILQAEGFRVNPDKTRVLRKATSQRVTGLVVNEIPKDAKRKDGSRPPEARVPRKLLRRLRAAIHNRKAGKPGKESLDVLRGWAAFVKMADPVRGDALLKEISALPQV